MGFKAKLKQGRNFDGGNNSDDPLTEIMKALRGSKKSDSTWHTEDQNYIPVCLEQVYDLQKVSGGMGNGVHTELHNLLLSYSATFNSKKVYNLNAKTIRQRKRLAAYMRVPRQQAILYFSASSIKQ